MSKVYVVQEVNGKNILPAQEFGEIKVLLPQGQIAFDSEYSITKLFDKLKDITQEDYLLLIGDPVAIAIAAIIASDYTDGLFKLLKWDREHKKYFAVEINIGGDFSGNK